MVQGSKPIKRFQIIVRRPDVPERAGEEAAADITKEFIERPWYQNVVCSYDKDTHSLILKAESEDDERGLGLMEEF
jgi:hypothetical protein